MNRMPPLATQALLSLSFALFGLASCSKSDEAVEAPAEQPPAAPTRTLEATLDADLVAHAQVKVDLFADRTTRATVTLEQGHGLFASGVTLEGKGRIEAFPEVDTTMYTAKASAPANPSGLCGDRPLSLSLTLRRVGKNDRVAGGLSAYCGADTYHGSPVRIVRLSGLLPP